jgi:hypothetical protein
MVLAAGRLSTLDDGASARYGFRAAVARSPDTARQKNWRQTGRAYRLKRYTGSAKNPTPALRRVQQARGVRPRNVSVLNAPDADVYTIAVVALQRVQSAKGTLVPETLAGSNNKVSPASALFALVQTVQLVGISVPADAAFAENPERIHPTPGAYVGGPDPESSVVRPNVVL